MEKQNIEENSVVFQLKRQLNKMITQVDFLIRNNKLISQLDLDVMMENTRELYDTLCSVKCNMDVDSIPMEVEDKNDFDFNFNLNPEPQVVESISEPQGVESVPEPQGEESVPAFPEKQQEENVSANQGIESVPAFLKKQEEDDLISEIENNENQILINNESSEEVESEEIVPDRKMIDIDFFIKEQKPDIIVDDDLAAEKPEKATISDVLEKQEDNSLAAHLQRKPIENLKNAIGINDKFLFVNELFNGSMEKYNKSVTALNEFKTLLGAKTYMGELQIELQWNSDSEAYVKLEDLVERRFLK